MAELPRTYDEWKYCITVKCGIALTQDYINERLRALSTLDDHATANFLKCGGLNITKKQSVSLNRQQVSLKPNDGKFQLIDNYKLDDFNNNTQRLG